MPLAGHEFSVMQIVERMKPPLRRGRKPGARDQHDTSTVVFINANRGPKLCEIFGRPFCE